MNAETRRRSSVVVALDIHDDRGSAIELAGALARDGARELIGVFVEDAELLEHAGSRLAREVMLSGAERAFERAALERQLRAQAGRARASFEAATARLGLRYTFEVARGNIITEAIKRAAAAEALVLSIARDANRLGPSPVAMLRQIVAARLPLVLVAREGWLSGRSIAVIVDRADTVEFMLESAVRLAQRSQSPISVLVTAASEEDRTLLAGRVGNALRVRGMEHKEVVSLLRSEGREIALAASACQARLVVAPIPSEPTELDLIEELWRRLPGALMLVQPKT